MTRHRDLDRVFGDVGDLLARHDRTAAASDRFARYVDDPVGFIRDVTSGEPWPRQVEIAEAVADHPLVTVRSCHAAGKDWLAARLALWWTYARRGLVVLTGPTAAQVEEIMMRREVREAFMAGDLPGELHVRALRPGGTGKAGIIARTATGIYGLTGLHESRVLVVITEAQDPDLDHAHDAAFTIATGEHDRVLTLGNPTEPDGRFYKAHQPGSAWHRIKIAARDIPNVARGRTVVAGLLTREGVARFEREYGAGSPFYISRVLAEFPAEATDSLVTREWLDRAVERHEQGAFVPLPGDDPPDVVLGVDPARLGPDRTVVCVRQGQNVTRFVTWTKHDTTMSAERVRAEVRAELEAYKRDARPRTAVVVDEAGLGGGLLDRLKETLPDEGVRVVGYHSSKQAGQPDRFVNTRAESYWRLRKALEEGTLALPDEPDLAEELLATRVKFSADGRLQIEAKDEIRARIGRSPDLADALVMALTRIPRPPTVRVASTFDYGRNLDALSGFGKG